MAESDMDLKLRKVDIDFSDAKIHWNPQYPEFSHVFNAFSVGAPCIEPFLIKVMRPIKDRLPESATELRRAVAPFNSQEGRHYRMHMKFSTVLHQAGSDTQACEGKMKDAYRRII